MTATLSKLVSPTNKQIVTAASATVDLFIPLYVKGQSISKLRFFYNATPTTTGALLTAELYANNPSIISTPLTSNSVNLTQTPITTETKLSTFTSGGTGANVPNIDNTATIVQVDLITWRVTNITASATATLTIPSLVALNSQIPLMAQFLPQVGDILLISGSNSSVTTTGSSVYDGQYTVTSVSGTSIVTSRNTSVGATFGTFDTTKGAYMTIFKKANGVIASQLPRAMGVQPYALRLLANSPLLTAINLSVTNTVVMEYEFIGG